jgi:hypothetical protein
MVGGSSVNWSLPLPDARFTMLYFKIYMPKIVE